MYVEYGRSVTSALDRQPDRRTEGTVQTRAFLILSGVVLVAAGTAPAAVAKKAPAPACAGQFAVAQSGIPGFGAAPAAGVFFPAAARS